MSTLIVALIIVLGIAVVLFLLVFLHNRQNKKRAEKMLRRFSELGSEHDLSFTGQEVFRNHIIGVDGIKRKLLLLENNGIHNHWSVIDLAEVKSCRVKKYTAIWRLVIRPLRVRKCTSVLSSWNLILKTATLPLLYLFINS
ncbi:MAG: hypothetical protein ICV84_12835 [Flavisolibacter sp.]|nr:hypothetical protein [Flavisolibacter sp.]